MERHIEETDLNKIIEYIRRVRPTYIGKFEDKSVEEIISIYENVVAQESTPIEQLSNTAQLVVDIELVSDREEFLTSEEIKSMGYDSTKNLICSIYGTIINTDKNDSNKRKPRRR